MSNQGEQGPRRERGEHGFTGHQGDTGDVGDTGDKGRAGGTGPKGDKGEDPGRRLIVLYVLVIVAFLVLAFRVEVADRAIRANSERIEQTRLQAEVDSCEGGVAILTRFNNQQEELAAIDEELAIATADNPATAALIMERARIYADGVISPLPNCDELPRP